MPRIVLVLTKHEEDHMRKTLAALDRDWADLDVSPTTATAVARWTQQEPALGGIDSLGAILERRTDPARASAVLAALARLALDDALAARTLLQAILPGLVRMATTTCADDPMALEELVSLAWERIRTYPTERPGSVAANVLMDVRKRYRTHRSIDAPSDAACPGEPIATSPSPEEIVLGRAAIDDVVAAQHAGVITAAALTLILRTRVDGIPLEHAAAEQHATPNRAGCIRWRAERRLRPLLATAS